MTDYEHDDSEPAGALTTQPRRDNQIARQDFNGTSLRTQNGAVEALVAKARAEVESACVLAKRWPRNPDEVRQDIIAECRRPGFAKVAIYKVPRAGGQIEGLSIRFAEVAMRCSGNMGASSETIYDDADVRQIRVNVVDYERNSRWTKDITIAKTMEVKSLKRGQRPLSERTNSFGERLWTVEATADYIVTKEAAEISKASRTGILRVIPGHLQDEARKICKEIAAADDAKDPNAARNRMFDAFAAIGVKPSALAEYIGHSTDTISPAEREDLLGLHAAIKEGETTWADALRVALAEREDTAPAKPKPAKSEPTAAAPAASTPVVPATPDATSPPAAQPSPPVAATPPAEKRTSSGKGTAALKGALAKHPESKTPAPEIPPGTPAPESGYEYRSCATKDCGVAIEVPKTDPEGAICETCAAGRE